MSEDFLVSWHRRLQGLVDVLGVRPVARALFRRLVTTRYGGDRLATSRQNGRLWKLDMDVALRGEFQEFETVQWLRKVLRAGDFAIDVGANVGQMTLEMAELVGSSGRVVAIEPAPGNVELLRRHVAANGFDGRVIIVAAACLEHDGGETALRLVSETGNPNEVGSGHSTIRLPDRRGLEIPATEISVPRVSIDALVARAGLRPRAIKIDVEGAELEVLAGARQTLREHRPLLRLAFHPFAFEDPAGASRNVRETFHRLGYRIDGDRGDDLGLAEYDCLPRARAE